MIIKVICDATVVAVRTAPLVELLIFLSAFGLPVTVTVAGLEESNSNPAGAVRVMVPDLI